MTTCKVFVYGTLKRGEPNHHWFTKSKGGHYKFLFDAATTEKFPLIIGTKYNIPFLLCCPGTGYNVKGEVYEVDSKVLADLDVLEDHPRFYVREMYTVKNLDTLTESEVWIYMIKNFNKELLNKTFLESYSDLGDHGLRLVARYLRGNNSNYQEEIRPDKE